MIKHLTCPNNKCPNSDTRFEWTEDYPTKYCDLCGTELVEVEDEEDTVG